MRIKFLLLLLIIYTLTPASSLFSRGSRSSSSFGSRSSSSRRTYGSSRVGFDIPRKSRADSFYKRSPSSGSFNNLPRKSGISNKLKYLGAGGIGLIGGIYLGSKLRSSSYYNNIANDNRFQICQGRYVDDMLGQNQQFVCPPDPSQFALNSCCYDGGIGYCCDNDYGNYGGGYGRRVGGGISGAIGSLLFLCCIGLCIYCCCCKNRGTRKEAVEMNETEPKDYEDRGYPDMPDEPQYPGGGSEPVYPGAPASVYPGAPAPAYPGAPAPAYPGAPAPAYPGSAAPAYPGAAAPTYPGAPQPGYPPAPGWN